MWYLLSHFLSTGAYPQQVASCLQAEAAPSFRFCCAPTVFSNQLMKALTENHEKREEGVRTEVSFPDRFRIVLFYNSDL